MTKSERMAKLSKDIKKEFDRINNERENFYEGEVSNNEQEMKPYETKDDSGRTICTMHGLIRCGECAEVYEIINQRNSYRSAILRAIASFNQDEHTHGMAILQGALKRYGK